VKLPRIGCVKYLNARPLIHGWPGEVVLDHPAALCAQLTRGGLDVALVSSFEFLRNPIYRIVNGVAISSDGPVYSVILAHQGKLDDIGIDPASCTSVNLLRCLLAEQGLPARWVDRDAAAAKLLIGDQAIRFRQSHPEFQFLDLGEEWKKIVDLPFVYALWLIRPEFGEANKIAAQLRALRDQNLRNIDSIIAEEKEFDREFCRRYYAQHLRFSFGDREKQGLQTFADLCARLGLIRKRELAFDVV
jgi:predicted solute-binding protein